MNTSNANLKSALNEIEATKVWGKENYEKLQKIMASDAYKANYAENLDAMILQTESVKKETKENNQENTTTQTQAIEIPTESVDNTGTSAGELAGDE